MLPLQLSFLFKSAHRKKKRKRGSAAAVAGDNNNITNTTTTTKPKRAHTGYTLYVRENYEIIKKTAGGDDMPSKDIISLVARQWSQIGEQEKRAWQYKAEQLKQASEAAAAAAASNNTPPQQESIEEIGLPEPPSADGSDNWGTAATTSSRKKPARKSSAD